MDKGHIIEPLTKEQINDESYVTIFLSVKTGSLRHGNCLFSLRTDYQTIPGVLCLYYFKSYSPCLYLS